MSTSVDALRTIRVLLIEDDEDDWILLQDLLAAAEGASFELDWVPTFDGALEPLLARAHDVILLDHDLGAHTGLEVLKVAAEHGVQTPIILLTGQYRRELDLQAMGRGAVDFLVKGSLGADILERTIRYAIHRARMDQQLAQARDAAIAATRHKSAFVANMSHEIRTPLNGVIGMTDVLLNMPLPQDQRFVVESILTSARSLMDIVNDILDFSKIESGRIELADVPFDPAHVLWDVRDVIIANTHAKGIELECKVAPDLPPLRGDPARLRQILANLAGNAVKFTHRGHVRLQLDTEPGPTGHTRATFRVTDTGIGIPDTAREHLFDPFTQVDSSPTRRFGGTGLGLSICRRLVHRMGGQIGFDTVEGEGSTFWFRVPLPLAPRSPGPRARPLRGHRLLLVDANEVTAGTLAAHLEASGVRCEQVSSVSEGIGRLRGIEAGPAPDTIIIDQPLLESGGATLAEAIAATWPRAEGRPRIIGLGRVRDDTRVTPSWAVELASTLYKPPRPHRVLQVLGASAPDDPPPAPAPTALCRPSKPHHILIADDNVINRRVAAKQLERLGYSADMVTTGLEVLDALRTGSYDLILMDCQMPGMDGYEATKEIRRRYRDQHRQPIVAMTASARVEDRMHCIEVGMDDYISKPVTLERLGKVLERWLPGTSTSTTP